MVRATTTTADQALAASPALLLLDHHVNDKAALAALEAATSDLSRVVILAVQPEPNTVRTRGIMKDAVARHLSIAALARIESVREALLERGVDAIAEVSLSEAPEAILAAARKHGCKVLFVPCVRLSGARLRWLAATGCVGDHLGARLAAASDIPVVILPIETGKP